MSIRQDKSAHLDRARKDVFKAWLVNEAEFEGFYEFPKLEKSLAKPKGAIPFHKALRSTKTDNWVHFFIDDYRFECVWHNPRAYLGLLQKYHGVISPDFSLYRDMPLSMQIWNTYRNRALGFWFQHNDIDLIPNVQWGDERSYSFCFEGLPKHSTLAVSTNGCIRNRTDRFYFKQGLEVMIKRLEPTTIVNYSYTPKDIFAPCYQAGLEVIEIPNFNDTVRGRCHNG